MSIWRCCPNWSRTLPWATAAWAGWRPVSSIRWPRSACPASATASATTTACFASASSTADRSSHPTTGSPTATPGSSRGPRSAIACALVAIWSRSAVVPMRECAGWVPMTCWRWPTTTSSPATAPRRPTRCGCGRRAPPRRSTSAPSTRATTSARSRARTTRKTSAECSTPMTRLCRAASCACVRNTSSARPACRTSFTAISAPTPASNPCRTRLRSISTTPIRCWRFRS